MLRKKDCAGYNCRPKTILALRCRSDIVCIDYLIAHFINRHRYNFTAQLGVKLIVYFTVI